MGKRAQRKRKREEAEDLARHIIENQVHPQVFARSLQEAGHNVDIGFVNTDPNAEGFTVRCAGCGRTAKVPFDPGEKVGLCPQCVRAGRGPQQP